MVDVSSDNYWSDSDSNQSVAERRAESAYAQVLAEMGLNFQQDDPWLRVGHTDRIQGWKLHLSSVPTLAIRLMEIVLPVLQQHGVSYKISSDETALMLLNEGMVGPTQIGKFMTVYPDSDEQARELACILVGLTKGFDGPSIATDLKLGSVVYTRYGAFNPIRLRDRLGQAVMAIHGPDGEEIAHSYEIPFTPPVDRVNPFADWSETSELSSPVQLDQASLFGPGFLLVEVLHAHPKGSVFQAIDLRDERSVDGVVIKEGRRYCCADENDRDMRTRLQRQAQLWRELRDHIRTPSVRLYFEHNGHGYLVLDYIDGLNFTERFPVHWSRMDLAARRALLTVFGDLLMQLSHLHKAGWTHRDITPGNLRLDERDNVWLLDLELAHGVREEEPPLRLGTPGYMSPEQWDQQRPSPADDIYAFGALALGTVTGLHPLVLPTDGQISLCRRIDALVDEVPSELSLLIDQCLNRPPDQRPTAREACSVVVACATKLESQDDRRITTDRAISVSPTILLGRAVGGLKSEMRIDETTGLWLSSSVDRPGVLELRQSANRGVAGPLVFLGRLAQSKLTFDSSGITPPSSFAEVVHRAVEWLIERPDSVDAGLPGLHFGEAGVAVALAELVRGELIERTVQLDDYIHTALRGRLDWPDVTHGAAGQGIAALACGDLLADADHAAGADRCAAYLLDTQNEDGSWSMPDGVQGMAGETLFGFAHGVAGIVYFLAEYAARRQDGDARDAWQSAAEWLIDQAIETERNAFEWRWSDRRSLVWNWWCHGAPGITLTFLRLFEHTGDLRYREVAEKALAVHPPDYRAANLGSCHGLAGLGEIYLEAYRVLRDQSWLSRARSMARTLAALRVIGKRGAATWRVEGNAGPTADLMVGNSGIAHFLLRLAMVDANHDPPFSFPLLVGSVVQTGSLLPEDACGPRI